MDNEIENTNTEIKLESKIEALLFYKGEPLHISKISELLKEEESSIRNALENLKTERQNTGLVIVENNDEFILGTHPQMGNIIEDIRKDEVTKDLSKAMLETLSIILYKKSDSEGKKNGVTRSEIDYVRGVNSSFILRNLLVRGLIQKTTDKNDSRRYIYEPTLELLQYMGVENINMLPNYEEVLGKLNSTLEKEDKEKQNE